MFKACEWFISTAFKQRVSREKQERRQKVVDDLYDAFSLSEMEPGGFVRLETKGDLTIPTFRKEASKWQRSTNRCHVKSWKHAARIA